MIQREHGAPYAVQANAEARVVISAKKPPVSQKDTDGSFEAHYDIEKKPIFPIPREPNAGED